MYNIVCDSLGIEPQANNGTLRLPLKPGGVHSSQPPSADEIPEDLPSDADTAATAAALNATQKVDTPADDGNEPNEPNDTAGEDHSYWAFVKLKFGAAKAWADEVIAKLGGA